MFGAGLGLLGDKVGSILLRYYIFRTSLCSSETVSPFLVLIGAELVYARYDV